MPVITATLKKFEAKDKTGRVIVLEWQKTDILSPELASFKKEICGLASKTLAPIETAFLRTHPEAVSQELFLKPCASFFENPLKLPDWKTIEETIQSTIKQFYLTDLSSFSPEVIQPLLKDIYFLVRIWDKEERKLLGFLMAATTPALPVGTVKIINLIVASGENEQGVDQLLMSSIFKIIPQIRDFFLFIRPTNKSAHATYLSWGFVENDNIVQDPNHKINTKYLLPMHYLSHQSNQLQEIAQGWCSLEEK